METCSLRDKERLRDMIVDEHEAVMKYQKYAEDTDDREVEELIKHITKDEKAHISELNILLGECDEDQRELDVDMIEHVFEIIDRAKLDMVEFVEDRKERLDGVL